MTESSFTQLNEALSRARNELIVRKSERDLYLGQLKQTEERWQMCLNERDLLEKVRVLFQLSAEHAREQAKQQLETLVTNALKYVFGSAFRFEIELKDHGGTPTAEFYVVSTWDGQEIKNRPQEARGGGIVDIVSLALRIALIETVKPRLSGPIILDEPGKHVSEDYIVPMIEFLKSVGETFGRQVIMVTHNIHLTESADAAYFVRLQGGKSVVEQSGRLDNGIA
ncbi:ATP-binding protein [Laceyella sacchari]|jgi:DNA repair exonuclease SbcCD ATPase subunit|uniref:ATP-binding protein n=1 Tax=Laceyella sacchari TaxID=37482 RepID=A0ABY5TZ09_LACSH|nr:ATP-binding protein [Laceyella sacchari]UWE02423.1 ATP-binding protein [Laceyella sacchari]